MSCCSACAHGRKCSGKKKRSGRRASRRLPSWSARHKAAMRLRRQGRFADAILALSGKGPAFKKNPLTRREAARALSVARKHGWFARKAARVGQIGVFEHHLGRMKGMRDVVRMFIDRRR